MRIITFDGVAAVRTEQTVVISMVKRLSQRHRIVSADNLSVNLASLF